MDSTAEATTLVDESSQGESPTSAVGTAAGHPRKTRVALACSRCKRRKQRCDGVHPVCTSCLKANVGCVYERTLRPRYPGGKSLYISALEERIAFLEERLPEHGQDHMHMHASSPSNVVVAEPRPPKPTANRRLSHPSTESASDEEEKSSLIDGVAYLSLCASGTTDTAPEPFYVGSSSGATVARLIQSSIFRTSKHRTAVPSLGSPATDVLRPSTASHESLDHRMSRAPPLLEESALHEFPFGPQAQTLFSVFFDRLHARWPILDRRLYCTVFERQWDHGALPIVHRSILHLIYAISARFLQLMKKNCDIDPERHFAAAIEPMDYILEQHNLATVQFLAMLALYGSRSPFGAGSWSQVRYAITLCIELGLHRKPPLAHHQADHEIRKRVFWACYCLDRMTTITLGRTFAIADRDINVELPSESSEFWYLTANSAQDWPNVAQFAHIIKLRRLQSKVFRTVWRVDKDILTSMSMPDRTTLNNKINGVQKELDEWLTKIPVPPKELKGTMYLYDPELACHDSQDYFNLQYHKTVLSLYTALLPTLPLSDPRFLLATQSAATICTSYKNLNAQKTLSYTIVALHSCFIAGLTLVYCLWREPALFSFSTLDATRACSLCLTIFGEKWPGAVKYRDIFDAMSGSLLKSIVGGGGQKCSDKFGRAPLDMDMRLPQHGAMPVIPEVASGVSEAVDSSHEQHGNVLFGAVKDAFMEVDGEAPGGWNGWRMFNEMVQSDIAMAPRHMDMRGESSHDRMATPWSSFSSQTGYQSGNAVPSANDGL